MTPHRELGPILFVDDEDEDFFLVYRLLKKAGLKNPIARLTHGADAIQFLRRECTPGRRPWLIFHDVKMPQINGCEVLMWIRTQPEFAGAKVIMLSNSEFEDDMCRAARLGADEFLKKFPAADVFRRLIAGLCPSDGVK
jgi:CheY-like chemotaxis protein